MSGYKYIHIQNNYVDPNIVVFNKYSVQFEHEPINVCGNSKQLLQVYKIQQWNQIFIHVLSQNDNFI